MSIFLIIVLILIGDISLLYLVPFVLTTVWRQDQLGAVILLYAIILGLVLSIILIVIIYNDYQFEAFTILYPNHLNKYFIYQTEPYVYLKNILLINTNTIQQVDLIRINWSCMC